MRISDWHGFNCGDLVHDISDERHVGRIVNIWSSSLAKVQWVDTEWISIIPLVELRHVDENT